MASDRGKVRTAPSDKRVRGYVGGELVIDTTDALYVWEWPHYPHYYLALKDVRDGVLQASTTTKNSPSRGLATYFTLKAGGGEVVDAAWSYPDSPMPELRERVRFVWNAMDAWFEEEEEVFVHPRDPDKRVQILPTSRTVTVSVDGVEVASSSRPTFLYESHLPRRTYFPKTDVRMDLFTPTDTTSMCPYKGTARYWTLTTPDGEHADLAWSYPAPVRESAPIAGLVAFWDERVDLTVDGVAVERPKTPFSQGITPPE